MLHWEDWEKKTKRDELAQFVDMAVIWNCIPEDDFDSVMEHLSEITLNRQGVKFSCHLNIPFGIMDALFDKLANPETSILIDSLSEAVPYADFKFRKTPGSRKIAYGSIWKTYLDSKSLKVKPFATEAETRLYVFDPDLAKWEGRFLNNSITMDNGALSFVGLIQNNYLYQLLEAFSAGAHFYYKVPGKNKQYSFKAMKKAFNKMNDIIKKSGANETYNLNFLVRYLFNVAASMDLSKNFELVAKVEYKDDEQHQKIISFSMNK
jgi:hypothetical protein